jgi:aspartate 1-decarboxylase
MLKSKIHRATVTDADLAYEGSITVDESLMRAANFVEFEQVAVWNVNNGQRFETYVIPGPRESGTICVNGSAARMVQKGDLLIIASFSGYDEEEVRKHRPTVVLVDEHNRPKAKPPIGVEAA